MHIIRGQANTITVTFQEKATTANPEWLIKFVSDVTGQEKIVAVTDVSDYPERYNRFVLIESEDEDLIHATVTLSPSGSWSYTAYEMAASSPRNMDTSDALCEAETGKASVEDTSENETNNFEEDEGKDNPVFDVE